MYNGGVTIVLMKQKEVDIGDQLEISQVPLLKI